MYSERVVLVSVETVDGLDDGTLQVLDGLEIIIVNRGALEVAPESFDEVEIRRIGGVPNDGETMSMLSDERLDRPGMMNRTVVQEQVKVIGVGVNVVQQPPKEVQKLGASFALSDQGGDFAGHRIQRTEDRHPAILARRRNDHALTPLRPAAGQTGVQMELGFIDIRESTTTGAGFRFFKAQAF